MVKISEFQIKDVVNVADGKKLGNISDIEINLSNGKIEAIIVSGNGRVLGFFGKEEEIIKWHEDRDLPVPVGGYYEALKVPVERRVARW